MRVAVKQQDIDDGYRNSCSNCPVSLAIGRRFAGGDVVRVDAGGSVSVWSARTGRRTDYYVPSQIMRIIAMYDQGTPMEPFSFELRKAAK